MDFYELLKLYKKDNSLSYGDIGSHINMSADAFRMAVTRKSLSNLQKQALEPLFIDELDDNHSVKRQLQEFSNFLSKPKYRELAFKDPKISKILDKEVARRLAEVVSSKEALEKFLNS
ncbi:hypothetical protein [Aquimarina algiphila]|uniref:Uncharacterized protein n=1 Tax=Aquimarina algiphila TaxID=2047982 RepID=A0A554VED1_9FLAO|nr:hypothetical protein [Aquimarina algiphila]TSE05391.1 hypothetical protein FOF46_22775 [Aquimarina algiphila]